VMADHTKWGTVGISSIVALERADVLITDDGLDPAAREIIAGQVRQLMVVEPDRSDGAGAERPTGSEAAFNPADAAGSSVATGLHG